MTTKKSPRRRPAMAAMLADPRWKMLASGRATPEEIADLRAWAQENETAAEAWQACRPATEREVEKLADDLLQKLAALKSMAATESEGSEHQTSLVVRSSENVEPAPESGIRGLSESVRDELRRLMEADKQTNASSMPPLPKSAPPRVIAQDPIMKALYEDAHAVANASANVGILIAGEAGVGKKNLAQMIHNASSRAKRSFVVVNCAAMNSFTIETDFFGFKAGAFSGVRSRKGESGFLETAEGGTIVLEGIELLPLEFQAQLLRVLDRGAYLRLGEIRERLVDVRFIAVTNADLAEAVARGELREDLYHRIRGFEFIVPPLRSRPADIVLLACLFLEEESRAAWSAGARELSPEVIQVLEQYHWPGNVRELRNVMMVAVVRCTGSIVRVEHLPDLRTSRPDKFELTKPRYEEIADEKQRIIAALSATGGDLRATAMQLGISRRVLFNHLNKYSDIPRPKKTKKPPDPSG